MPASKGARVEYASRNELVAVAGPVVIRMMDGRATTIEDYRRLMPVLEVAMEQDPAVGFLHVFHSGTPPATPEVRRHAAQLFEPLAARLASVMILTGDGLSSKLMRNSAQSVKSILRNSSFDVARSIDEGARMLALDLVGIDPELLASQCEELHVHMRSLS
ncbi:hypothetical protein PPSIR1_31638 [Plesiocystis pacifica SIR-1]|uniref:Uncharacterized protein n=1 Tax=Plesiocystis pacifica SIR-1 TaxID=391625 RepID=A6G2P5_9BACT|nr:hypothetical protein [Plesiocystis pacifica]EDM79745.1 hypothetical protein PPSIR1_31638 [Plesiocystis pacifica SIR-1]